MKKVGELLKAEREKKGLSLHEVGMTLKINPKILKALEENDSKQLPAKTFVRGFVRSYAQFLRLDPKAILEMLQTELEPSSSPASAAPVGSVSAAEPEKSPQQKSTPAPQAQITESPSVPKKRTPIDNDGLNTKKIATMVGIVVLVAMIVFVAKMVDKYQKERRRPEVEVTDVQKINTDLGTIPPVESAESSTDNIDPVKNSTPAALPLPGLELKTSIPVSLPPKTTALPTPPVPTPMPTQTPMTVAKATPTPAPSRQPTPTPTATPATLVKAAPTATPTPTPTPAEASVKPVEVIVEALNKVEIKYSLTGDEKIQTLVLNADEVHTFRSKGKVQMEVSDGGSVSLIVNGRDKGVPGKMGQSIKLTFPK